MQMILDNIYDWCMANGLTINFNKCECLYFLNKIKKQADFGSQQKPILILGSNSIPISHEVKILGVFINDTLNWQSHTRRVRSRINGMINALRRAGSCLNADTRCKVFNAFVKPHILFSATVWGNGSASEAKKMDTTLTHATRVILRNPQAKLDNNTFRCLGLRPFRQLLFHLNTIRIFHILNSDMANYYLCSSLLSDVSQRSTRGTDGRKFVAFKHKRSSDELGFHCQAIRDWNTLPVACTSLSSLTAFNQNVLSFLANHDL
jgi:hypothetical protein